MRRLFIETRSVFHALGFPALLVCGLSQLWIPAALLTMLLVIDGIGDE
jgi:hypothetical protein